MVGLSDHWREARLVFLLVGTMAVTAAVKTEDCVVALLASYLAEWKDLSLEKRLVAMSDNRLAVLMALTMAEG